MDAIRDTNAAIAIPCQGYLGMFFQRGIDTLKDLGMTKVVLRHSFIPQEDTMQKWISSDTQCEVQFFFCQCKQVTFIPWDFLPGASTEDTEENIALRRAMRELGRGPSTGEGAASFAAWDYITISIQVTRHIALFISKGNSRGGSIGNAL